MTNPINDEQVPTPVELHALRENLTTYLDKEVPNSDTPMGSIVRDIIFFVGSAFGCEKNPDGYEQAEKLFRRNMKYD